MVGRLARLVLLLASCGVAWNAFAADTEASEAMQSRQSIIETAHAFLEQQVADHARTAEVEVDGGDPRLRLPACASPPEAFLPRGGRTMGSVTVGVRCEGPKPWTLYLQGRVKVLAPVVVTSRPLSKGTVIRTDDVQLQDTDLSRLTSGYYEDPSEVVGKTARWSLQADMPLGPQAVEPTRMIRRGDRVAIVASSGGIKVQMQGEAVADGAQGEVIKVRNLSSKRVVEGEVTAPGTVRVRF